MSPRTGRRPGDSGTREAILVAARQQFASHGYSGATVRSIAAAAGVDPALLHHFFGSKEQLFAAAVGFPAVPSDVVAEVLHAAPPRRGDTLVRALLQRWDSPGAGEQVAALLRSSVVSDSAARMLREFLTVAILDVIADTLDEPLPGFRATLVVSQVVGLAVVRYVLRIPPLAEADVDDVVAAVGPTVQRYFDGEVGGL